MRDAHLPPKLELCHCGKHGRIVLGSGFQGPEFGYRQHGLRVVETGLAHQSIRPEEVVGLIRALEASKLPSAYEALDFDFLWRIEVYDELRAAQGRVDIASMGKHGKPQDPQVIHDFLSRGVASRMPRDFPHRIQVMDFPPATLAAN